MNGLVKALCSIDSEEDMAMLLEELLTDRERDAVELRWELMRQLKEGKTQRAVAKDLHVSLCKVTRGNRILKDAKSVSRRLLEKEKNNG